MDQLSPTGPIESRILYFRGRYVMLDRDVALIYGVSTKALKQAVKRNRDRFPEDFMFEFGLDEARILRSQTVTSKDPRGGDRYVPLAFTEQGIAMLSSILRSERAVHISVQIIRAFIRLRQMIESHEDLKAKLYSLEKRYDKQFKVVFDAMHRLLAAEEKPKQDIGFQTSD